MQLKLYKQRKNWCLYISGVEAACSCRYWRALAKVHQLEGHPVWIFSSLIFIVVFNIKKPSCEYEATHLLVLFDSGASIMSLSSRLWSTVSKAALRFMATSKVRLKGIFWLRPFCILLVTILRAVAVKCSGLKPCCSLSGYSMRSLSKFFC